EVREWARPYVEQRWKITAMKVQPPPAAGPSTDPGSMAGDAAAATRVAAASLRLSFKTDRPLFPYREPDPRASAERLGARSRLLRIYFLSDARYDGELTATERWTGRVAWAGRLSQGDRAAALDLRNLPASTG